MPLDNFLLTHRDVKRNVLIIMCRENQTTNAVNSEVGWKDRVLKHKKFRVSSPRNFPNLDIYRSLFLIAHKVGGLDVEWASELRKTYGSDWVKRYADILDPMIAINLNFRVEPSGTYG